MLLDLTPLIEKPSARISQDPAIRQLQIKALAKLLAVSQSEGLALYRALPTAELFHRCKKKFRIIEGSNRAGKTNSAAAEVCRFLTGRDPYDKAVRRDGQALIVGLDGDHLALMWKNCAEEGAFSIIRDEHTDMWRAVRPDPNDPLHLDPYDLAYREKWRPSPPFLSPRLIKSIAWEEKAKGIPRRVILNTGWDSLWRSSKGDSPQGQHLNLVWIDEHIENEDFFEEGRRGIVALAEPPHHIPRMIWSATPQNYNHQLSDLRERAERASLHVGAFKLLIAENPYIPDDEKAAFFEGLSEDEKFVRWFGNPAMARQRVYPGYDPQGIHGYEPFMVDISRWTRYLALDPGRDHCATIFVAVDPNEEHVWTYDAFDLRNSNAQEWAGEVAKRQYDVRFEAFVIDKRMGKQTAPGAGRNTAQHYFSALIGAGVEPTTRGPLEGFFPGMDDIPAREEALLSWLVIRGTGPYAGTPILKIAKGMSPQLDQQFRDAIHLRNKRVTNRGPQDLLTCLEYMASFGPRYKRPQVLSEGRDKEKAPTIYEQFLARRKHKRTPQPHLIV